MSADPFCAANELPPIAKEKSMIHQIAFSCGLDDKGNATIAGRLAAIGRTLNAGGGVVPAEDVPSFLDALEVIAGHLAAARAAEPAADAVGSLQSKRPPALRKPAIGGVPEARAMKVLTGKPESSGVDGTPGAKPVRPVRKHPEI